jgi:2'-5' RNA ligase
MKKRVTVYWLIPAKPEYDLFRDIIRILSQQFDAPRFEPHLTLCQAEDRQSPRIMLRQIQAAPIRLPIRGVHNSANFAQTLFVKFTPNKSLQRLVKELGGSKSIQNPHVSLLYKKLPPSTRRDLAAAIKMPFREVIFDQVKAVSCVTPTETQRDVKAWRVIATKRLSG